ncbi:hypothetical protein O1L60_25230 [Streptomyces diastatochromogenes]|nr:hypothetical protein [Streptomyces diastatochromogenes]
MTVTRPARLTGAALCAALALGAAVWILQDLAALRSPADLAWYWAGDHHFLTRGGPPPPGRPRPPRRVRRRSRRRAPLAARGLRARRRRHGHPRAAPARPLGARDRRPRHRPPRPRPRRRPRPHRRRGPPPGGRPVRAGAHPPAHRPRRHRRAAPRAAALVVTLWELYWAGELPWTSPSTGSPGAAPSPNRSSRPRPAGSR